MHSKVSTVPSWGKEVTRSPISSMPWTPQKLWVPNTTGTPRLATCSWRKKRKSSHFPKRVVYFITWNKSPISNSLLLEWQACTPQSQQGFAAHPDTQHQHQGKLPPARSKGAFTCEVLLALIRCRESMSPVIT